VSAAAILLAGGSATRLGSGENKVYLQLGGVPMLAWSLQAFEDSALIDDIVLVVREADRAIAEEIAASLGLTKLRATVTGGDTRHDSERAGLESLADAIEAGTTSLVAIHDAARPFVRPDLLERILVTAAAVGGAIPALPLDSEFLLHVDATGTSAPVDAGELRGVQTPQAFHARELLDAYRSAAKAGFHGVDTAESVERFSTLRVEIVTGDPGNTKVTFFEDLILAEERAAGWPREWHQDGPSTR
jgi:2-C-methyl-D-erythritol 4-phosphate cytidylyltransferase